MIEEYLNSSNERPNLPGSSFPAGGFTPEPTERDYQKGHIDRYFLRKTGTSKIIEVSKEDFDEFSQNDLFIGVSIKWKISGPRNDIINSEGYPVKTGVKDTNRRILEKVNERGIIDKLNDLLEFWDGRNRNR